MKIRDGFVSNSSSSSFIVKLDKDIDDYTLEEFRELCNEGNHKALDPIARLYEDLKHKTNSKREFDKWDRKYLGVDDLEEFEYLVTYGDDDGHTAYLEYEVMPYLNITKRVINGH